MLHGFICCARTPGFARHSTRTVSYSTSWLLCPLRPSRASAKPGLYDHRAGRPRKEIAVRRRRRVRPTFSAATGNFGFGRFVVSWATSKGTPAAEHELTSQALPRSRCQLLWHRCAQSWRKAREQRPRLHALDLQNRVLASLFFHDRFSTLKIKVLGYARCTGKARTGTTAGFQRLCLRRISSMLITPWRPRSVIARHPFLRPEAIGDSRRHTGENWALAILRYLVLPGVCLDFFLDG
jgi:hypothetical protein